MCSQIIISCIIFLCLSELKYINYIEARRWKGAKKSSPPPPKPRDVRLKENQKMVAFDLDGTMWSFNALSDAQIPIKRRKENEAVDKSGKKFTAFPDVAKILKLLQRKKYLLAAVSQDSDKTIAEAFLHEYQFHPFFTYIEIYPGPKTKHIQRLQELSGLQFKNILFFDNDERETANVERLNVTVVTVDTNGLSMDALNKGLQLLYLAKHDM